MKAGIELLEKALNLLGKFLDFEGNEELRLVVCGGAALIIQGFRERVTEDVDIVAYAKRGNDEELSFSGATQLPENVSRIKGLVADELNLEKNWLNTGPSDLFSYGMPEGFQDRLFEKKYSRNLTVYFVGRLDQIFFKVYAAADQGPGKHIDDLMALNPSEEELKKAVEWVLTHDSSDGFKTILKSMIKELGYENLLGDI